MTSIYPKQPGYTINHDPTKVDFKKISSQLLQKINFGEIKPKQQINLPRQKEAETVKVRQGASLSYSQETYKNHFGDSTPIEQFQPDWVKLEKQVLRFFGYFKESVEELKVENSRIRNLIIYYYLTDDTISITEGREVNSGLPQGPFLKRGKVMKDEFSFIGQNDLIVGQDVYIYGKCIRLYNCDDYTREYYNGIGVSQPLSEEYPLDSFHDSIKNKIVGKKDNSMKDYLEHRLGGGRVRPQKQFLENDRKVLKFNAKYESLKYIIHYYLADDTVEVREVHHHNSGRDPFPLFLKRAKLPRRFSIAQPGEIGVGDFYKESDFEVFMYYLIFSHL
jgi:hypothetical protein